MSQAVHQHEAQPSACPYCGLEITSDEFLAIEARLTKEQQEKFDVLTKRLNAKHLDELSEVRKASAAKDKDNEERMKAAGAAHEKALAAKDRAMEKQVATTLRSERAKWDAENKG